MGVSWKLLFAYSLPLVIDNVNSVFLDFQNLYYVDYIGLDTTALGVITAFTGAAMFIMSPVLAYHSDNFYSKYKTRKLILFVSLAITSISVAPQFFIPSFLTTVDEKRVWLTFWSALYMTASTVFDLNWSALALMSCDGFDDRVTLFGVGSTVGSISSMVAFVGVAYLPYSKFFLFSILSFTAYFFSYLYGVSVLSPLTELPPSPPPSANPHPNTNSEDLTAKKPTEMFSSSSSSPSLSGEGEEEDEGEALGFVPTVIRCFRNHPFVVLFITQTLVWLYFLEPGDTLFRQYVFGASKEVQGWTDTANQMALVVGTPLLMALSSKVGKQRMFTLLIMAYSFVIVTSVMFVPNWKSPGYWYLEVLGPVFSQAQEVFNEAVLADIVDYDQMLWGGAKRASIYYSVFYEGTGIDSVMDSVRFGLLSAAGFHVDADGLGLTGEGMCFDVVMQDTNLKSNAHLDGSV